MIVDNIPTWVAPSLVIASVLVFLILALVLAHAKRDVIIEITIDYK